MLRHQLQERQLPVKITKKLLAQRVPATTSPTLFYRPPSGKSAEIKQLIVCNQSAGADTFSIFIDKDGTKAVAGTAIYGATSLAAHTTLIVPFDGECGLILESSDSSITVQCDTSAGHITFSIFGFEIEVT